MAKAQEEGRDKLTQLETDLLYLAKRQKIIEDAVCRIEYALQEFNQSIAEWSEFMTIELLKQGIVIHKNKTSFEYFRNSLKDTHKEHYEKFESLFLKIKQLFGERKRKYKY